jgi:hypothetical protein
MQRIVRVACLLAAGLAVAGCSSSDGGSCGAGLPGDAGTTSCNSVSADGPCVAYQSVTGTAPPGTGGTIIPGTYVLTSVKSYGTNEGISLRETLELAAVTTTSLDYDVAVVSGSDTIQYEGTGSISGTSIQLRPTCPAGAASTLGTYSATATTFMMVQGNLVALFSKS